MGDSTFNPCAFQNRQKQIAGSRRFQSLLGPSSDDLGSHLAGTKITVVERVGAGVRLSGFIFPVLSPTTCVTLGKLLKLPELSFLICKMGVAIVPPHRAVMRIRDHPPKSTVLHMTWSKVPKRQL